MKRAMIGAARRTVLLADHSKVGNDCMARFGGLGDVDLFITDTGPGRGDRRGVRRRGHPGDPHSIY